MVIRENLKETKDQLTITKAAAWAWYERGSWFEHKSLRESDCKRTSNYTRTPSRYKLEAMNTPRDTRESRPCVNGSCLRVGNSLLDTYEIKRITSELDCYFKSSSVKHLPGQSVDGGDRGGRASSEGKRESKSKSKSKSKKGFWIGRPMVCAAARDDVVNSNLPRRQKEQVMVDGIMNFRRPIIHGGFR